MRKKRLNVTLYGELALKFDRIVKDKDEPSAVVAREAIREYVGRQFIPKN